MQLIKNFTNATTFVEDDTLKGHVLDRMLIFAAGVENRGIDNVDSYDPVTGRINFRYDLGGILCTVLILS